MKTILLSGLFFLSSIFFGQAQQLVETINYTAEEVSVLFKGSHIVIGKWVELDQDVTPNLIYEPIKKRPNVSLGVLKGVIKIDKVLLERSGKLSFWMSERSMELDVVLEVICSRDHKKILSPTNIDTEKQLVFFLRDSPISRRMYVDLTTEIKDLEKVKKSLDKLRDSEQELRQ